MGDITMISIFRLEEIRAYDSEEHWYLDASIGILGYYSTLEKAVEIIPKNNQETYDPEEIYAYMVKEIAVDGDVGYVRWFSVRSYDTNGNLIDQCLQNYNLVNQFEGRQPKVIRFHVGDIVEVLEGHYLFAAIIEALPPTPEDYFPVLDAEDDSYLVLPLDDHHIDHLHIAPTHTFRLNRTLEKESIDYLHTRLAIAQKKEADMRCLCVIEDHDYLYNFTSLPLKCICRRCHQKWKADFSGDLIHGEIWKPVDAFENDNRTDEELIKAWGGQ